MNTTHKNITLKNEVDPIDDYLECVTYCSVENLAEGSECQTICMERYLIGSYF